MDCLLIFFCKAILIDELIIVFASKRLGIIKKDRPKPVLTI